jgi:hypothetical protein
MIAALRTTLAAALVVLACAFAPAAAAPSGAAAAPAECSPLDLADPDAVRERAAAVTDVFAGRVLEAEPRTALGGGEDGNDRNEPSDGPTRAPDPRTTRWQHTVNVVAPFESDLRPGDRVLVVTQPAGRAEGLGRLDKGATYVFFASGEPGMDHLIAGACSGTTKVALTAGLQKQLEETLGEPPAEDTTPDYTLSAPEDGSRSTPSLGRLVAPGAALALIGVLGLLLVARIASRRA